MTETVLREQALRYKGRILVTVGLVMLESALELLYPLVIGLAFNDLVEGSFGGILRLAGLGLLSVAVGTGRRFYDARTYSGIYSRIASEMAESELAKQSSVSKITARSSLLNEFTEFLEWSIPQVIGAGVSLVGILIIVAGLDIRVFFGCLSLLVLVLAVYAATGRLNLRLNASFNDQFEKQVEALESRDRGIIRNYFSTLMRWQIRLSDLDTATFAIVWSGVIALLLFTPISIVERGTLLYGSVFALGVYVFNYIDVVVELPDQIQQVIRLNEISRRLSE
ncbi:MAG: ABC transporter six-transmembrane domain-containing protein [Anderseniella sp.]|nr:ABC transporter six-transmembrane domain-containing protein [Anderseniella sp.]